jgi:predicted PurR-regulated permease PerM
MQDKELIAFSRKAFLALLIVAGCALIYQLSYLLLLIFASAVIAVVLRSLAAHFLALKLSDGLAVALAVLSLLAIIVVLGWLFGGLVTQQFVELGKKLPSAIDLAQRQLDAWNVEYNLPAIASAAKEQFAAIFSRASGFVISAGGVVADVAVVFVGGVFFAADPAFYRHGLLRLVPRGVESVVGLAFDDCARGLKSWLKGQLVASACIAGMTLVGLMVLGVPSPFALALIAGALDFIPYIGPFLAAVPGVLVGFSASPMTALWTAAVFMVVQQIQNNVVQPLVQKNSVDMPPAVLLFSLIAAGILFGVPGVLLATPMTIVGCILVQHFYIGGVLGREVKRHAAPKGED